MEKKAVMSDSCSECVFQRSACVLGRRRPWNAAVCDDYQPYCLDCGYPDMYCNTCRNQSSKALKPLVMDAKGDLFAPPPVNYDCVWSPSEPAMM